MIYIFSKDDLSIKQIIKPIEYNINFDEETNGKSTFQIEKQTDIESGDIVFFKPYYFLVNSVEGEKNSNILTLTCVDLVCLFDREIIEADNTLMLTSIEEFIGQAILKNYVQPNDNVMNVPYVQIAALTQTAAIEPTNSQNYLYNLKTFIINCRQNKNIYVDFRIIQGEQNILQIDIQRKEPKIVLIDTTVAEVSEYQKIYEVDVVAKVECFNRETEEYSYLYLRSDRTVTADENDPLRIKGATKSISVSADTEESPMYDEMVNVFKGNSYNHLIQFKIKKSSKLVDVSSLKIGTKVKIKTNDDIYDSYISAIEFTDNEFVFVKTGQIRVSLTDKLSQQKRVSLGNKVDVVNFENQVIRIIDDKKSIITATLSANQGFSYSTANSNVKVELDSVLSSFGNNITFDNTANRFVIGSGVSKVKISAAMTFSGIANSCRLIIRKYDGTNYENAAMAYFRNPTAAYTNTIVLPPMLIDTAGIESFHMVFLSAATGKVTISGGEPIKTYMTVEEV